MGSGIKVGAASRGANRERQVARLLESEGWAVTRGAGSHGCADLWAGRRGLDRKRATLVGWGDGMRPCNTVLRLIQVKTDKAGPWANFRPKDRRELSELAAKTGGIAELWWHPARGKCRIYLESEWPDGPG